MRCVGILRDDLIKRGKLDVVIESIKDDEDALIMEYSGYDIDDRYKSLIKWHTANLLMAINAHDYICINIYLNILHNSQKTIRFLATRKQTNDSVWYIL